VAHYVVLGGLFVLSLITYVDRAAISSVKDPLGRDLGLSDQQMGAVFSAFALGYALAQIPAGWFADRFGPRAVLAAVVGLWSLLTAWTGWAGSLSSLLVIRFLFGVAEAGAFPGSARVFYNWLPRAEHGRANGIIFSGSRIGAAGAFPLMAWLLSVLDWRTAFAALAVPGIAWAVIWYALFRDHPARPVPREDPATEVAAPLADVFRTRGLWLAMAQYFALNFTTFLCLTWMNPYLKSRYGLETPRAAFYSMIVLLLGATAQWVTGFAVDRLYASAGREWSRRGPAIVGFLLSAAGLAAIPGAATAEMAVVWFVVAAFGAEMTISPSWAYCLDVGKSKAGAVSGSMNMAGNIGSFVSANAFPYLQRATGGPGAYFYLVAAMSAASALCWLGMRSAGRPQKAVHH